MNPHPISNASREALANLPTMEARDAAIIASAAYFNTCFFVGTGWERFADIDLKAARATAAAMRAAYPNVSGKPMIYAVEASGASALVPDGFNGEAAPCQRSDA